MRYPFSPEYLDSMPEKIVRLYRELEIEIIENICRRLREVGEADGVVTGGIQKLRSFGISEKDIEDAIVKVTGISKQKLSELFTDAVEKSESYYHSFDELTMPEHIMSAVDIEVIQRQTLGEFDNISRSMAFVVDGRVTEPAKAFRWAVDKAIVKMQTETVSYNEAIRGAVNELAKSGLMMDADGEGHYVTYGDGKRHVSLDVAVRRAVMTGISKLSDQYTQKSAEFLDTRYYEISAHSGARDKDGPNGWENHKAWQGRVYYESQHGEKDPAGLYPDLHDSTGFGEVDGLEGINCRHRRFPWVEGVSERTYTDQQLKDIDDGKGGTFEGRTYSAYEATQKQREIESTIRALKKRKAAYKAAGLNKELGNVNIRLHLMSDKYKRFCEAMGFKQQTERLMV